MDLCRSLQLLKLMLMYCWMVTSCLCFRLSAFRVSLDGPTISFQSPNHDCQQNFTVAGLSLWNSFPAALRRPEISLCTLKWQLRDYLFYMRVLANIRNVHHSPVLEWCLCDSGTRYKTADLFTYLEIGNRKGLADETSRPKSHGRRSWGGRGTNALPPKNLEWGIVPPDFVMLQNFKHQITCITM